MLADLKYYILQYCHAFWSKAIVGIIGVSLVPNQGVLCAAALVFSIDFLLGISLALKMGRFSSAGLRRGFVKLALYALLICAVSVPENEFFGTSYATRAVTGLIVLTELISILENMTLLGLPVPFSRQLMKMVADKARLYGLSPSTATIDGSPVLIDLMDLLNERIPTLLHSELRVPMKIYVRVWINFAASLKVDYMAGSPDIMFERVNQQIDLAVTRAVTTFREQGVPEKHVRVFLDTWNADLLARLKAQLAQVCGASKLTGEARLYALRDFVALMLYRLMAAVRRFDSDAGDVFDSRATQRIDPSSMESPSGLHPVPKLFSGKTGERSTTDRVLQFRTPTNGVQFNEDESSQLHDAVPKPASPK